MQVIKPFRISVLSRCFENEGKPYLSLSLLVLFSLDQEQELRAEKELWELVGEELPDSLLDLGMPKKTGELLLCASAHPPGAAATACRVRAQVGSIDRTLYVSGDRYWKDGKATEPKPFEALPITWANAFGGEGFDKNPLGKGYAPKEQEHHFRALPNIENPDQLLRSPSMHPAPVCFLPVPATDVERLKLLGTCDKAWLETRFPGFAADMDWSYFNLAQRPQINPDFFVGDEAFSLENLCPGRPRLSGKLPGARSRCFVQRRGKQELEELRTRLDTVFLFPHRLRGVLVFRAAMPVQEDDAADIERVLTAAEWIGHQRPVEHYQRVFEQRVDKEKGHLYALRESELMPDRLPKGVLAGSTLPREGFRRMAAKRRVAQEVERVSQLLIQAGQDPEALLPKIPTEPEVDTDPELIPEQVEMLEELLAAKKLEADQQRKAAEVRVRALCLEHKVDFDQAIERGKQSGGGPPKLKEKLELEALGEKLAAAKRAGMDVGDAEGKLSDPGLLAKLDLAEQKLLDAYQSNAHVFPAAAPLEASAAKDLGQELIRKARAGESLSRLNFTGADLAGEVLDGLDLSGAFLEGANLSNASLRGSKLIGTVLARANLRRAVLDDSDLTRANLGEAELGEASLARAQLERSVLMRAKLGGAGFQAARLSDVMLFEAELVGADFTDASLPDLQVIRQSIRNCNFSGAELSRAVFVEASGANLVFDGATLRRATFVQCSFPRSSWLKADLTGATLARSCALNDADFRGACLERATLGGSDLRRVNFGEAKLFMANLSEADARESKLYRVDLRKAALSKADLRGSVMASANAMQALLDHADLRDVDLRGANLFRSDLSKVRVNQGTLLDGALVEQARVVGRREDA